MTAPPQPDALQYDHYVCEVWCRGHPARRADADARADDVAAVLRWAPPAAKVDISVGGCEDDPRELVDIPEVMAFLGLFTRAMRARGLLDALEERLTDGSRAVVLLAAGRVRRDQIQVVGNA